MSKLHHCILRHLDRTDARHADDYRRIHAAEIAAERGPASQAVAAATNPMERAALLVMHEKALFTERVAAEAAADAEQVTAGVTLPTGHVVSAVASDPAAAMARLAAVANGGSR